VTPVWLVLPDPFSSRLFFDTGIVEGFALISAPHTTCAIIVNEAEPGFLEQSRQQGWRDNR